MNLERGCLHLISQTNKQAVKIQPRFQSNFLSSEIWLKCISDSEEMLFNYFFSSITSFCYLNRKDKTFAQHMTETIMNNKTYTIFLSADILIWQKRKQVIHRKKINTNSLNEAQKNIWRPPSAERTKETNG